MNALDTVTGMLKNVSVTFASISYATKVRTSAAHKNVNITKVTKANVQLFGGAIKPDTSVFGNAVKRSASKIAGNDAEKVAAFEVQENYFEHTDIYSIVRHRKHGKLYLYTIMNHADSEFFIDGKPATRQEVASFQTRSDAEKTLGGNAITHNVGNDVDHAVTVRAIELDNIKSITFGGMTVA